MQMGSKLLDANSKIFHNVWNRVALSVERHDLGTRFHVEGH